MSEGQRHKASNRRARGFRGLSRLSPTRLAARTRESQAFELRLAGLSFEQIAVQVGYTNRGTAYQAIRRVLVQYQSRLTQHAEELRLLEDARYDEMLRILHPMILKGDLGAMDRALRISQARRQLWGLDAPAPPHELSEPMRTLLATWDHTEEHTDPPSANAGKCTVASLAEN